MTFTDWLESIFGTAVVLGAIIGAFWKIIINHIAASVKSKFDKDLATHVDLLRQKTDTALKQIEIDAAVRNIKLTEVITIQVKAIAELYSKLLEYKKAGEILARATDDAEDVKLEKGRIYVDSYFKMRNCYNQNRIFLPDKASKLFDDTTGTIWKSHGIMGAMDEYMRQGASNKLINDLEKQHFELQKQLPTMLESLEREFKRILGINDESK